MKKTFLLSQDELRIPCNVTCHDGAPICRAVLGVHGIGGSKDDKIQADLAEEMALFSAIVYRFDFPAHGESPIPELTLDGCVRSVLAVARHIRQQHPQVEDLCLFATGFGAYVALVALPELMKLPGQVKLVLQTPCIRMDQTILAMTGLTRQTLWALDHFSLPTPRPLDVTYRFYEELHSHSAMAALPIPLLILHGQSDAYIRQEDVRLFHELNDQSELLIIPGVTHRFLEDGAWDMVVDLTRDWFEFQQVLLM